MLKTMMKYDLSQSHQTREEHRMIDDYIERITTSKNHEIILREGEEDPSCGDYASWRRIRDVFEEKMHELGFVISFRDARRNNRLFAEAKPWTPPSKPNVHLTTKQHQMLDDYIERITTNKNHEMRVSVGEDPRSQDCEHWPKIRNTFEAIMGERGYMISYGDTFTTTMLVKATFVNPKRAML